MAVNATAIWRARPSGNNTNGGGYDPGIASPGTDYSQQNAAQVTFNGTTVTASTAGISATISITGYATAATDVANALHITGGTNFIVGWYFIVSRAVGTWTLDRNCTTGAGAAMTGSMGGGWADFFTNTTSTGPLVPGNIVYILGSGTPNPSAYTYDYSIASTWTPTSGDTTNGFIVFANDPNTPGYKAPPDTTGGMPTFRGTGAADSIIIQLGAWQKFMGLWAVGVVGAGRYVFYQPTNSCMIYGCVCDQFGARLRFFDGNIVPSTIMGNEGFSSTGGGAGDDCIDTGYSSFIYGNNIHDWVGNGVTTGGAGDNELLNTKVINNIIAKCSGIGIKVSGMCSISNNTIDGNTSHGIEVTHGGSNASISKSGGIFNNIISNHTGAGTFGIVIDTLTAAQNDRLASIFDYNVYYNNSSDLSGIDYGPHDTHGGSDPYVAQSTENYTLK